ncbi:hypothetical protein PoB_004381000 [Plakobranchus ocellatus]|uniref:Uncharacterized protein n=1 Tax=Plakobranchus ocellatus TaxID=259542 RepID=A0AAV4B9Q2_9GAST|nr:hypothetical protein PoB_004381000 [Plakobranchus ocellatus]
MEDTVWNVSPFCLESYSDSQTFACLCFTYILIQVVAGDRYGIHFLVTRADKKVSASFLLQRYVLHKLERFLTSNDCGIAGMPLFWLNLKGTFVHMFDLVLFQLLAYPPNL